jgi:hypothetical protein
LHPTTEWTVQQFRDRLPIDGAYRLLLHDRDGIFAPAVDAALDSMALRVLKTPVRAPQANAHCERFIGTARRECLDWMIPLNERHLRRVLAEPRGTGSGAEVLRSNPFRRQLWAVAQEMKVAVIVFGHRGSRTVFNATVANEGR